MAETKYTYLLVSDFPNQKVDISRLSEEIQENSDITIALDYINSTESDCDIWFKDALPTSQKTVLDTIIGAHSGEALENAEPPTMEDGRPLVRADTRPLNCETYFTSAGDNNNIGDGVPLFWDFSNSDNDYTGSEVPNGFKAKQLLLSFKCPVFLKDGTVYFFDAPWMSYIIMDIIVPDQGYFPNPAGVIPASALGLPGDGMYSQASGNTVYQKYVNRHHIYGSCPMGDELNAEGAAVNPIPVGWFVRGLVVTPDTDVISKGFGCFEMYRCHTTLLPGQTFENVH